MNAVTHDAIHAASPALQAATTAGKAGNVQPPVTIAPKSMTDIGRSSDERCLLCHTHFLRLQHQYM